MMSKNCLRVFSFFFSDYVVDEKMNFQIRRKQITARKKNWLFFGSFSLDSLPVFHVIWSLVQAKRVVESFSTPLYGDNFGDLGPEPYEDTRERGESTSGTLTDEWEERLETVDVWKRW